MIKKIINSVSLLMLMLLLLAPFTTWAGNVQQVRGTKALIDFPEGASPVGTKLFLVSPEGKKIAIVEIKQVKGTKAIAEIIKGQGLVGATTLGSRSQESAKQKSFVSENEHDTEAAEEPIIKKKQIKYGVLFGYAMNTFAMDIGPATSSTRESASLTGNSFSLKLFGDYDYSKKITFRGATGIETLSAKGSLSNYYCDDGNSPSCSVNFTYLAAEGSGHYNYLSGKYKGWVGLGYSFLLQAAVQNNIPNLQTSGSYNQMFLISTGVDIARPGGKFIPLVLEMGIFPGTEVKASAIYLRGGYSF